METNGKTNSGGRLRTVAASAVAAGAGAGLLMGWLNVFGFAWKFPHIFASPATLFFWGGSVAFWYLAAAAVGSAVLAFAWTLFGKVSDDGDAAGPSGLIACVIVFSIAWLWTALWLNFGVLGSPRDADGAKLAANGALLLAFIAGFAIAVSRTQIARVLGNISATLTIALAAVSVLGFAGSLAGVNTDGSASEPPVASAVTGKSRTNAAPNVVLLTIDTLRADHLGLYGYERDTSPFLDELAEESVVFENSFSAKTNTSPSVASFLTGEYPHSHGIHDTGQVLADEVVTLAERMAAAGYASSGIVTNGNLVEIYNFDQGFDAYVHGRSTADRLTDLAIDWLDNSRKDPFFLWVHYIDPHSPYSPPSPYDERYVGDEHFAPGAPLPDPLPSLFDGSPGPPDGSDPTIGWYLAQYDGEIRFNDEQLRRVYDRLDALDLLDDTLVVLTSDHGECFGEDEYYGHGLAPHDAGIRVPLIFRLPQTVSDKSGKGIRSPAIAGGVDIVPTILDVAGIPADPTLDGRSLVPSFDENEAADSFAMIEAGTGIHVGPGIQQILRTPDWKYVHRDTAWALSVVSPMGIAWLWNAAMEGGLDADELYDMASDPHETRNLVHEEPQRAERMRGVIAGEFERIGPRAPDAFAPSKKDLERQQPDLVDELRELGYMD